MNFAIEATPAIKNLGGVSEYTRQLIRHLGPVDTHNLYTVATVSLFRNQTTPLPKLSSRFRSCTINLPARLLEASWYRFGRPSLDPWVGRQDVILFPRPLITASAARRVVTVHDLSWLIMPNLASPSDVARFRHAIERSVRQADHLIAVSLATKRDLIKHFGLNESKITVTHLGFDQSLSSKVSDESVAHFRQRYRHGSAPFFLHVGTLEPRKNLTVLVKAFETFKKKTDSNHKLVLIGRLGWCFENLLASIEASPNRSDIILTGAISDGEKHTAYAAAETVVFPSLYEGFGLPILEGQAADKPVLTGTGGSLAEIGSDSVLAVDVRSTSEVADGLERLAVDSDLRQRLIKRGQQNIRRFNWAKTAAETVKILENVVQV